MTRDIVVINPGDPAIQWSGYAWLEKAGDWYRIWRLPPGDLVAANAPHLARTAGMPAGVHARFRTAATRLALDLRCDPVAAPLDVRVDGALVHRGRGDGIRLPGRDALVEVWMPQYGETWFGPFRLNAPIGPAPLSTGLRWIAYGSSITQCRAAAGPSETWPALVARANGWRLRCWGFDGQCHLDPVVIRAIRDCDADLISLCLGINVYGQASFSRRTFAGQVSGALHTIREGHPRTPLVVISPIVSPSRENTPNQVRLTLAEIRSEVVTVVRDRQHRGDEHLHLVDGLSILGAADAHLLHDGLHPSAEGYQLMGERLSRALTLGRVDVIDSSGTADPALPAGR